MQALDGEMRRGNQMAKQILEEVIEESARKRSGYEGLNEWMWISLGGAPSLTEELVTRIIGSLYNGYNVFDPNHPGLLTQNMIEKHPKLSALISLLTQLAGTKPLTDDGIDAGEIISLIGSDQDILKEGANSFRK